MTSSKRLANLEKDLLLTEEDFRQRLVAALRDCASGALGLFGPSEAAIDTHFGKGGSRYKSAACQDLLELANEIYSLRNRLGYADASHWAERFEHYSYIAKEPNAPGEPKLAQMLLAEIMLKEIP